MRHKRRTVALNDNTSQQSLDPGRVSLQRRKKKEEEKKQPTVVHASVYTTEQSTAQQLTIQEGEQVPAQSKLLIILLMRQQERVRQQLLTGADLQVSVCCPASSRSKLKKKISKCRVATTETG